MSYLEKMLAILDPRGAEVCGRCGARRWDHVEGESCPAASAFSIAHRRRG